MAENVEGISYKARYYRRHPEIKLRYRLRENANFLRRYGYQVIPPAEDSVNVNRTTTDGQLTEVK